MMSHWPMAGPERKSGRTPLYLLLLEYTCGLPHIQTVGKASFVTWTLAGVEPIFKRIVGRKEGRTFAQQDRELDEIKAGPRWLGNPEVAEAVRDYLMFGQDRGDYELGAWVIMPNHAHLLIKPTRALGTVMRDINSGSARMANRILNREGEAFWQSEYHSRVVRDSEEGSRIMSYIERNPVRAGLCGCAEEWKHGSAHEMLENRPWAGATPDVRPLAPPEGSAPAAIHHPA